MKFCEEPARLPKGREKAEVSVQGDKRIVNGCVEPIVTCSELNSHLIKERYRRNPVVIPISVDYDFFSAEVIISDECLHSSF